MLVILALSCMIASISDLRDRKIYNKNLCYGAILGLAGVLQYYCIYYNLLLPFLSNLLVEIALAFLFFKVKIWGAGDSKLWILICFLYPFGRYYTYDYLVFPSLYILMFIFIIAYMYVLVETIYIKVSHRFKDERKMVRKIHWRKVITNFAFCFFLIRVFHRICMLVFEKYYYANVILFTLLGFILSMYLYTVVFSEKIRGFVIMTGLILVMGDIIMGMPLLTVHSINFLSLTITAIVLISKDEMIKYNYEVIPTDTVRAGMILSYTTIMELKKSRVHGLPQFTDESAKHRISQMEAEAIKRWSKSKYGKESIIIVRFLPFGIFMALGVAAYFTWSRWWS